ncbi:helix-turn-helix domain-containing protein [Bacillus atrophaeus]|uniref:Transcriptional regulator phage SPbeta n=1 Tax=Bacillus atrophaeus (strain 1942) TaxID=720555 RepID=A0ABN3ZCG5_BACA1|nr:helix-turn-helix transcriptional regulator [Bacillus atrophaeus]AMR62664.1 transcriptional regulator [Bacillus subtilis subsp. globigii]ADP32478.1 putative transcriptional regulator; phage SPbeta [Bacillus atrophaeus 1942]AIK47301.1 helix-turn-helix domain protein [Bacillus atrophaeus subsp. globigii]EIM11723.1 putative transcriptional regulator [Bacillus atrophaeus C89]KFK82800.1 helix-turn-helix domain protein [Bacillus atrophaeus]
MSKLIKKLMEKRNITIERMSEETMIDIVSLRRIIDEPDEGDVISMKLIALVLDVSIDDLLNDPKRREE